MANSNYEDETKQKYKNKNIQIAETTRTAPGQHRGNDTGISGALIGKGVARQVERLYRALYVLGFFLLYDMKSDKTHDKNI